MDQREDQSEAGNAAENRGPAGPKSAGERRARFPRWLKIGGALAIAGLLVLFVLWQRCGLHGCPDVNRLKGYMPNEAATILDREGEEVGKLFLTRRVVVPLDSLPKHVPDAFVAIEDKRFWEHSGVDWRRVLGAAWTNVRELGVEQGSSTITMQLARNAFPDDLPASKRTAWRKIGEARVARKIEKEFTKEEILELYLNQIYFGNGAWGIEAAAQEYFGKSAKELKLSEAALLAALPRAPSRLNPRNNRERALEGRKIVLERMREQGLITAEQAKQAEEAGLRLRQAQLKSTDRAPYFVEAVRRLLEEELGDAIYSQGYSIHTTLDLAAQRIAEEEFRRQLGAIESGQYGPYRHVTYAVARRDTMDSSSGTPYLQGAVVFMDPRTGDVRVLIGGRDYDDSEYNRATQARRQAGSAFKPFVYAAAIAAGYPPTHRLLDEPLRLPLDASNVWEPRNYDGRYAGPVTMREALAFSRNIPTVRLAMEVGLDRVISMAHQAGLEGDIPLVPSVALGTAEVTPIDLTAAFGTFATLGAHPRPRLVTRVVDRTGRVVWAQQPQVARVMDPAVAFIVTSMLKDVVNRGTAAAVRSVGFSGPAAGKTGTTNDAADIWFVGYTPRMVGGIWIGFDRRQTVVPRATGGELAGPLWGRIMRRIGERTGDWAMPGGVEMRTVDSLGNVALANCMVQGVTRQEYFLSGSAPVANCYYGQGYAYTDSLAAQHQDSLYLDTLIDGGWWDRLRRRIFGDAGVRDTLNVQPAVTPDPYPDTLLPPLDTNRIPGVVPDSPAVRRGRVPLLGNPTGRDTAPSRRDSARIRRDTTRRRPDTRPPIKLLGKPVVPDTSSSR